MTCTKPINPSQHNDANDLIVTKFCSLKCVSETSNKTFYQEISIIFFAISSMKDVPLGSKYASEYLKNKEFQFSKQQCSIREIFTFSHF